MNGFGALHPVVQHHIVNVLGWGGLRPLQEQSIGPVLAGSDAVLLAPTAGGKTEAAMFPLLTRMAEESWTGTSVLYVCPLRALLNNLERRVDSYAAWLGRSAAVRHGDTSQGARRRMVVDRPDVLLTTPESIEAMLVSATLDPRVLLGDVRAVVVDEVHAFAGDDRGWHLLAVLERLTRQASNRGWDVETGQLHLPVGQGRPDRDVMVGDHRSIDSDLDPRQRGIGRVNKHEGSSVRCERHDPAGPNHRPVTPHDGHRLPGRENPRPRRQTVMRRHSRSSPPSDRNQRHGRRTHACA